MPFYDVSRSVQGGWAGTGVQTVYQTKTVQANTPPTAGAGQVVALNPTATAQKDWGTQVALNPNTNVQTVLPSTFTDHYGGFPH